MIKSHEQHGNTSELISALERDIRIINEQPTAYDVYEVVEELEKKQRPVCINPFLGMQAVGIKTAIEIVMRGGVSENSNKKED
jgi:hypothetical protein